MALILTRSPYFVSRNDLDEGASLVVEVGDYDADSGGFEVEKTFTFNYRNGYFIDISPFLNDYLGESYTYSTSTGTYVSDRSVRRQTLRYCRVTLSGEKAGVPQSDVVTEHHITKGYLFSTDDFNKDFTSDLEDNCYYAGSSDVIYKLNNANTYVSYLCTSDTVIASGSAAVRTLYCSFLNKGEVIYTSNVDLPSDYSEFHAGEFSDYGSFLEWGQDSEMIDEETYCSEKFQRGLSLNDIDQIIFAYDGKNKVIDVKSVPECKYNPYRIKFRNRYGVFDYLWFFKKSVKSINVNRETYRSNSIQSYTAGDGVNNYRHFNTNGKERMVLNSDWVDERLNESFRQLMLSEYVELYDFDTKKTYKINLVTSDLTFKTHLNDKLINYEITVEFAHEVINNVG